MPPYSPDQVILDLSFDELRYILLWVEKREKNLVQPITVLIGGWAVYAYNPYLGSLDIDLLTNNDTKESLKYELRAKRGFQHYRKALIENTVVKYTDYGEIKIDFGSRERLYPFEGREESLNLDICDGNTEIRNIRGDISAVIPNKSLLLLFKLKAAWDRAYRIKKGTSDDTEFERAKLIKDYADILALLDPSVERGYFDFSFLGEQFKRFHFLEDIIRVIPDSYDALSRYGRIDQQTARQACEKLLLLIGQP